MFEGAAVSRPYPLLMSEAQEQAAVVEWCEWRRIPVFHIPNGGARDARTGAQLKRQGVKRGVPDLFVPVPSKDSHGLFIEMKRKDGGTATREQREWIALLRANGYRAEVCHGAREAVRVIGEHVAG